MSDAEVASWADQIRRERRATAPLHYVNCSVDARTFTLPKGVNVVTAIGVYQKVLADKSASKDERVEALKFLVHFVGDVHQPLHCADRNGDKGGNAVKVIWPGRDKQTNLHSAWDTDMLRSRKQRQSVAEFGDALNQQITEKHVKDWSTGNVIQWATGSWKIARDVAYADVSVSTEPVSLSEEYVEKAGPIVNERLQMAGVRLAMTLNKTFGGKEAPTTRPFAELFTRWIHSQEEDADGVQIYRAKGYKFPPARG